MPPVPAVLKRFSTARPTTRTRFSTVSLYCIRTVVTCGNTERRSRHGAWRSPGLLAMLSQVKPSECIKSLLINTNPCLCQGIAGNGFGKWRRSVVHRGGGYRGLCPGSKGRPWGVHGTGYLCRSESLGPFGGPPWTPIGVSFRVRGLSWDFRFTTWGYFAPWTYLADPRSDQTVSMY